MTVSSELRKAGPALGNGATTVFPFTFKVFAASEIVVTLAVVATGVESTLTLNSDYTVSLNADQDASPGGSVTYNPGGTPMASTHELTLTSNVTQTQGASITNGGGFFPKVVEHALDRVTILVQQLALLVTGALRVSVTDDAPAAMPSAVARAGKFLAFDSNGDPIASAGGASVAVSSAMSPVVTAASLANALTALGISAFAQTLLDDADAAAARATLGTQFHLIQRTPIASAVASIAFADLSGYTALLFVFEQLLPTTNAVNLLARVSTNNGSSYISTASYDSAIKVATAGATEGAVGVATGTSMQINGNPLSNGASLGVSGSLLVTGLDSTTKVKYFTGDVSYSSSTPLNERAASMGVNGTTSAINAVQFLPSSGTLASGAIACYGIKGS